MKTFRRITAALLAVLMLFGLAACGEDGEKDNEVLTEPASSYVRETKTKIAALSGMSNLCISKFSVDRAYNYETTVYNTEDEIAAVLKDGGADIAVVPVDFAAKLYNETSGAVQLLAVNSLGFFHVIENGEKIQSIADLKGKTVYAAYQGTAYEAVINHILTENGIDPEKDISLQNKATATDAARLADDGTAEILILPEPYASKLLHNNKNCRKALDLNAEWNKISETSLAQTVVVARKDYIEAKPDIIKEFMSFEKISINYLKTNLYGAPVFLKDNGFVENAVLATDVIAGCNFSFLSGEEMKAAVSAVLAVYGITVNDAFYYGV